jgi:hypothetical protein
MVRRIKIEGIAAMFLILALAGAWAIPAPTERTVLEDIDGRMHGTIERIAAGKWAVLFFIMTDCPIANRYSPEIRRICTSYGPKGAQCFLVYADPATPVETIRQHLKDYNYTWPAILDSEHKLVRKAGATVSSEVAVFTSSGELKYRGRIDNFHAALGVPRQRTTEFDLRNALDALVAGHSVRNPRTQAVGCFIPE